MPDFQPVDSFHIRQVTVAVSRERAIAITDLVGRMSALRYHVAAFAVVEHAWARAAYRDGSLGRDAAAFVRMIASGPVATVSWDDLTPIDRPTFTDRWLRTVPSGVAYGPRVGGLRPDRLDAAHVSIHDDVLALFCASCEIRHTFDEEDECSVSMPHGATGASFETCFVLRDEALTGVFVFGEED